MNATTPITNLISKFLLLNLLLINSSLILASSESNPESPESAITVIGLGRLGLCTALCFEKAGYQVLGVDLSSNYVAALNHKTFTTNEPLTEEYLKNSLNFKATTALDHALDFSDIYFIVVDTPSGAYEAYDHAKLSRLLSSINQRKIKNKHIVICCTIFPGYIKNVATLLLKDCENCSISYNPEFIAQGNIIANFQQPDMILIGEGSKAAGDHLEAIYRKLCLNTPIISRMSAASAEITKLAVNCFVTTKISYANMIGEIADNTPDANKFDILKAVGADSRVGSKYLVPGYGFGGPCFPRDNRALGAYAKQIGIEPLIPTATDSANKLHAQYMADKLIKRNLDSYIFEDVNYKDNCPVIIIEESQKLAVAEILAKRGCHVLIRDHAAVIAEVKEKYGVLFNYEIK
jgi:nucleotide sugar dehydrogenase